MERDTKVSDRGERLTKPCKVMVTDVERHIDTRKDEIPILLVSYHDKTRPLSAEPEPKSEAS